MATLKKIKKDLETVSTVSTIVDIYQKTAYSKMMKIRREVLRNREFLTELAKVYHAVKKSSEIFPGKTKQKKNINISSDAKKKGEVVVFLSANHFFYGTLILDIWAEVYNYWKNNKVDLVVIGRTGKYLAENYGLGHKIFCFDMDDAKPETEKIIEIINFIRKYKKVTVSHGKFESVLVQNPIMSDVLGGVPAGETDEEAKEYIFEPSPEAVLEFFETEIMASLFNQTILEHSLARYATRMISMYKATENAKKIKKVIEKSKRRLEWQALDKKQVEVFSASQLWNKKT